MKSLFRFLCVAAVLLASSYAYAQNADFQRDVLRPIDIMPSAAWLDANFEDPQGLLIEAATKASDSYERRRAITLLSIYPNSRSRAVLEQLSVDGDTETKRMAVYTLGRTFGATADAELVDFLDSVIRQEEERVQQWAVRALRWVAHPRAKVTLERIASSDGANAGIARRALKKHVTNTATTPVR